MKKIILVILICSCAAVFAAKPVNPADTDKDGKISLFEFMVLKKEQLSHTNRAFDEEFFKALFAAKDVNHDGFLSYEELSNDPAEGTFNFSGVKADTDKDGKISPAEFMAFKKAQGEPMTEQQIKDLFEKKDINHDGFLSPEEMKDKPVKIVG